MTGTKDEKAAIRAFKMCYVNANRKGENSVHVAIGADQKRIGEQRQRGRKVEVVDIFCEALRFCAVLSTRLQTFPCETCNRRSCDERSHAEQGKSQSESMIVVTDQCGVPDIKTARHFCPSTRIENPA